MATDANVGIKIEDDDVEMVGGKDKDPWIPTSRADIFIDVMEEEVKTHGSRDTGVFQPKSWERMRKSMIDKTKYRYEVIQLKNKFFLLRTLHTKFKQLCEQSGVGWCPVMGTVTAEPEIWEKLFKINDKAKLFKKRGFPHFAAMTRILGDSTATGSEAHPSVRSPSRTDSSDTAPKIKQENSDDEVEVIQVGASGKGKGKGKKAFDMKALKISEPKVTSRTRKRDSFSANLNASLSALVETNKRKVDILEAKYNAKSASASLTSQDCESQSQLDECMEVLNAMDDLDGLTFTNGLKLLQSNPAWRPTFLKLSDQRRRDFLKNM